MFATLKITSAGATAITSLLCGAAAAMTGHAYVSGVPCWNQPIFVGAPGGASGDWRAWCVPTAAADIVGYYGDAGIGGIGDAQPFPATGPWGAPDFQDDCADAGHGPMHLGHHLDTNGLGAGGGASHAGTRLIDVRPGLESYLASRGFGTSFIRNYGSPDPGRMPASLYCAFDTTDQPQGAHDDGRARREIAREIDAGRPLLGHFVHGNVIASDEDDIDDLFPDAETYRIGIWDDGGNPFGDDETGEQWDAESGLGHTMTIVGYWPMPNPAGVDAVIVFDNRDTPPNGNPTLSQRRPLILPWPGAPWAGLTSMAPARLVYVDADATGADDGTSWTDAYVSLQDALADASASMLPAEIWLAEGTYTPAPPGGSRAATLQLTSGVALYGGFDGSETTRDQRDPGAFETILSGDLDGDDDVAGRSDNAYHVVTGIGADGSSRLDGFTIAAGFADGGGSDGRGAGLLATAPFESDGPTIVGCTFLGNEAIGGGGAVFVENASITVRSCSFLGNVAGLDGGGAVHNWRSRSLYVNCVFSGNGANGGAGGGAMRALDAPGPTIANSSFTLNRAVLPVAAGGGGALLAEAGSVTLANVVFWGNENQEAQSVEQEQILVLGGSVSIDYSCVEGWSGALGGVGNIGDDPLLTDPDGADGVSGTMDDDLHLTPGSSCRNAGNAAAWPCLERDRDGNERVLEFAIDIGAYEFDVAVLDSLLFADFESGALAGWSYAGSTNGLETGTACPGTWSSDVSTAPIIGSFSMRLFAEATASCSPWQINAIRSKPIGRAQLVAALLRFDQIQGTGGTGHSFFQILAVNAAEPSKLFSYTFSMTGDLGGDARITVTPGTAIGFAADIAADYGAKYGEVLTDEVRLEFRASADFAENGPPGDQVRTTEVIVDDVEVIGYTDPCPGDTDGNGSVDVVDLLGVLAAWGSSDPAYDIAPDLGDGTVDVQDLLALLAAWGPCFSGG